jgi:hypothetical protein
MVLKTTIQELYQAIDNLPPERLPELLAFIRRLQIKRQTSIAVAAAGLGGLWQDVPLEIDEADIRRLRYELTVAARCRPVRHGLSG